MNYVACPRDCYDTCFFKPKIVENGFVLEPVPEPFGAVAVCPRAAKESNRTYSNERVLYPYIKREGGYNRVDWDTALDEVAGKLKETLDNYGPESILFVEYAGNMALITRLYPRRLWYFLNATFTDGTICDASGDLAISLHYGSSYGASVEEMYESKLFVYWGYNPALTNIHNFKIAMDLKKMRDVPIVVIDVYRTRTAAVADLWIKVRPGTDTYLALGLANYLIENEMIDRDFIDSYSVGFEEFRKYVSKFSLEYVSSITGVGRKEIVDLAEIYWENRPSITFIGYGLQRRIGGGEAARSIALIPALLGIHRGFYYSNTEGLMIDFDYISGKDMVSSVKTIPQSQLGKYLIEGKFKFVYIHLTNPVFSYPNSRLIVDGLMRDDVFLVVHETHWSETAKLADVVLPAPTWPEKDDIVRSYWHKYLVYNRRIIDVLGESRPEYWVMWKTAKKLGLEDVRLYEDPFGAVKKALGEEIYNELMRNGYVKVPYKPLDEYQTPSGRIEFYSSLAERRGFNPLPTPVKSGAYSDGYLNLITTKDIRYTNSQFRDAYGKPTPVAYLSRIDMDKFGLKEGDFVVLENNRGRLTLIARASNDVPEGVVVVVKNVTSLDKVNVNEITSDEVDEFTGATINSTLVKIRKSDLKNN